MVQAYWMCDWKRKCEVTAGTHAWTSGLGEDGKEKKLRVRALSYVRVPAEGRGLTITEEQQKLEELVGVGGILICWGLYEKLLVIAADKEVKYRGWIVTGQLETMDAALIARRCRLDMEQVTVGLRALQTVGLIKLKECSFAKECGQPVRFEAENVKMGNLGGSNCFPENSGKVGNPSEPKPNTKGKLNITESEGAAAETGRNNELVKKGESGGLIQAAAEESGSGSVESESEDRGISESEEPEESEESGNRACSSLDQRLKEPSNLAEPQPGPLPSGDHIDAGNANGILNWQLLIGRMDIKKDYPDCLLNNLHENNLYARVQLIERMMIWFRLLCPSLEPKAMASDEIKTQAAVDECEIGKWCGMVWDEFGPDETIELIRFMQDVRKSCDKRRSRIVKPVAVWVAKVKNKLSAGSARSP